MKHLYPAFRRTIRATTILISGRRKTTSAQHVAVRHRDPTFEKLMDGYKHLIPITSLLQLILSSPSLQIPLPLLSSHLLHLRHSPSKFLRSFPAIFSLSSSTVHLTPAASTLARTIFSSPNPNSSIHKITRLLSLSIPHSLPLRTLIRVQHDLALPQHFQTSIIASNPSLFHLSPNPSEPNTHLVSLSTNPNPSNDIRLEFKQTFPPGMRLTKNFRSRIKEWQSLPYPCIYEPPPPRCGRRELEKRAVAMAHEFLGLTVEKMVEVEKFSHFRKAFGIDFNVRDLFLDHPGMFYLSEKGGRHTVFLREAYDGGCLIEGNPIYEAKRRLLQLVLMGKRGAAFDDAGDGQVMSGIA